MKDISTCILNEHTCSSEFDEDSMDCGDFFDLAELAKQLEEGDVDIYGMAERLTNLLSGNQSTPEDEYDDTHCFSSDVSTQDDGDDPGSDDEFEWANVLLTSIRDKNLLLAGYTDCMDEAIRYLVEEENYSIEHPVVQGLRQHLVSQKERVLSEAVLRTQRHLDNSDSNNNSGGNNQADGLTVALLQADFCNTRPPPI